MYVVVVIVVVNDVARRVCVIQERKSQQKGETTMRLSNFSRIGRFLDLREEHVIFTSKLCASQKVGRRHGISTLT